MITRGPINVCLVGTFPLPSATGPGRDYPPPVRPRGLHSTAESGNGGEVGDMVLLLLVRGSRWFAGARQPSSGPDGTHGDCPRTAGDWDKIKRSGGAENHRHMAGTPRTGRADHQNRKNIGPRHSCHVKCVM